MRVSASTMILSLAAALLATGWSATATPAAEPSVYQVSGNLADDAVVQEPQQEQEPCTDRRPLGGIVGDVFGRFLNPSECDPHWSFTADGVAMQRSNSRSQILFWERNSAFDSVDSEHLDFPSAMGFQLGAIRRGPCGLDLELGYFQIDGWEANASAPGTSVMITDAGSPGFLVTNGVARYRSAVHLAEINVRRQWLDGLTLLAGFRTGELNELYTAYGVGARTPVPVSLNTNTFNHLYGFQVGADYEFYNMGGPLRISALCKSGIYGNSASQSSRQIDTGSVDQTLGASRNQATFMGEAGAVLTYQVTCHLSFRASCQAMWIEGVALAPEQIGATNFTAGTVTIDTHGGVFYYGGGLGMELKF